MRTLVLFRLEEVHYLILISHFLVLLQLCLRKSFVLNKEFFPAVLNLSRYFVFCLFIGSQTKNRQRLLIKNWFLKSFLLNVHKVSSDNLPSFSTAWPNADQKANLKLQLSKNYKRSKNLRSRISPNAPKLKLQKFNLNL